MERDNMASSPETTSLVSGRQYFVDKNSNTTNKMAKNTDARDYDSLNNLMYLESDCESILNEGKIDFQRCDRESDTLSVSTKISLETRCCFTDCKPDACAPNRKLMFKDELDKHRSLVKRDIRDGTRDTENNYKLNSKKSIWRSFISLCIGLLFAFMSFMPLRNIQTSLYPLKHLGNVSLASMYSSFAIGCLFSSWITQNARPKGILLVALFGHVMYCAANIYPSMYSLIPSACFFGFFHAPMWSAQELMIASYGASYTAVTYINIDKSIQQFQGVFLIFCHAAQVFGNLIESAILHCGDYNNESQNQTVLGDTESVIYNNPIKINNVTERRSRDLVWIGPFGYRIHPDMSFPGDKTNYENIVKFVFVAFAVMGMTIICLFLNKPDIIIHKKKVALTERLTEVGRFLPTATFLSLFLLMLFTGMQQAVVIGSVTKIYGTMTLGLSMVGYMMMCYGTCQLVTLLLMEKLHRKVRPSVLIFNAFILTLGLLVWLYIGDPSGQNNLHIFGYISLWGAVDGLWQSQVQTVLLTWSIGRKEAAVTVFRTVQSLGLVLVFILDIWVSLLTLICISGAILVFGVIFYLILEVVRTPLTSHEPAPFSL